MAAIPWCLKLSFILVYWAFRFIWILWVPWGSEFTIKGSGDVTMVRRVVSAGCYWRSGFPGILSHHRALIDEGGVGANLVGCLDVIIYQ